MRLAQKGVWIEEDTKKAFRELSQGRGVHISTHEVKMN